VVTAGTGLTERQRAECRQWPNQTEVTLRGNHFVQEDSPAEMARAIGGFADAAFSAA